MKIFRFKYNPAELLPYIDWSYFYHAWRIKPEEQSSHEGLELKREAMELLAANSDKQIFATFCLCSAHSDGDDIIVEGRRFPMLRQQHNDAERPNLCLADFISPIEDKIGLFATSVESNFENSYPDDDYRHMVMQTLGDRLAEAAASRLHSIVRTSKELWGYSPDENFTPQELNSEPYTGIRPAIGYPSLPDQSIIFLLDRILHLQNIGIELTPSGAMLPHSSVCGLMFAHPAARYFSVGRIDAAQFADYAQRRGIEMESAKKFLSRNII